MEVPQALLEGWRALEDVPGFSLSGEIRAAGPTRWLIPCSIRHEHAPSAFVPVETNWFIRAAGRYPCGEVSFLPAVDGGIEHTFHHQLYNAAAKAGETWRTGKICLERGIKILDRRGTDYEEDRTAAGRLWWHATRAVEWVNAAATGSLVADGEPFELPHYPCGLDLVGFRETGESLERWCAQTHRFGIAKLQLVGERLMVVRDFCSPDGTVLRSSDWGIYVGGAASKEVVGLWLLLDKVPALPPWQCPSTWGELRSAVEVQGVNLDTVFRKVADDRVRDGAGHPLMLGFPIPEFEGDAPVRLHWFSVLMPRLSRQPIAGYSGGRQQGLVRHDVHTVLSDVRSLSWLNAVNLDDEEVLRRGRWDASLAESSVVVVGAGALGSFLSECLARAGVQRLWVIDNDSLSPGNLARHTLDLDEVGQQKAIALARRLNRFRATMQAEGIDGSFPDVLENRLDRSILDASLVLDCTANDDVIRELATVGWKQDCVLASFSIGAQAERLYLYVSRALDYDPAAVFRSLEEWFSVDAASRAEVGEVMEGVGCHHPVFPARFDQIVGLCALAVSRLEEVMASPASVEPELLVFGRVVDEQGAPSLRRCDGDPD